MKKKFIIVAIAIVIAATAGLYAYSAGYCLKCNCHQYYGGSAWNDHCTTCGHDRAEHM